MDFFENLLIVLDCKLQSLTAQKCQGLQFFATLLRTVCNLLRLQLTSLNRWMTPCVKTLLTSWEFESGAWMVERAIPFLVIHRRGKCTATSTIVVAHITACSTKSQYLRQTWLMFNKKKAAQRQERFCVREIVFWWLTITRKGGWWQCHLSTIANLCLFSIF